MGVLGGILLALAVVAIVLLITRLAQSSAGKSNPLYAEPTVQREIRKKEKLRERQQSGKGSSDRDRKGTVPCAC